MKAQLDFYIRDGYDDFEGGKYHALPETNTIIRYHHDQNCVRLCKLWWNEIKTWTRRDQLSFNYVAWKMKAQVKYFEQRSFFLCKIHKGESHIEENENKFEFDVSL